MGNMGSPMFHQSFVADISHFHCSIEKTNKENLDNHPIVVCILASVAIFAVGLISNSMGNANDVSVKKGDKIVVENVDLLAFWAPFLLSLPHNSLWIPTMLMFMTAKSANKAKKGNLTESEVVQYGYQFFGKFKGLVIDMIFSRRERNQSRYFFLNRTAKDAFKVVEVELNFIYEVLFTKLPVVFDLFGAITRDLTGSSSGDLRRDMMVQSEIKSMISAVISKNNAVKSKTYRTCSLYLASADRFKDSMLTEPDPGPNYAKILNEYISKKDANLPTRIQMVPEPYRAAKSANKAKKGNLTELEVVQYGYQFFDKFKGLVIDMIFSRRERNQSRYFFLNRTTKDAFKVVEVELNFIYEVPFTKLPVVFDLFGAIT
nr:topoisomerase I damage affected protein [Tanacetum cinerariifolium]